MLCLAGTLTVDSVRLARGSIRKQMKEDTDSFCFDLSALDRIDSAGMGELIAVYSSFRKARSLARFRKLSSGFRELLQIARLLSASVQAGLISPQDIEPVVLEFRKLHDDILYAVPGRGPVIWCLFPKNRNAFKFDSGGGEYFFVNKDGTPAAKPGRHENHRTDVFLEQEIPDVCGDIQRDWFRLANRYRG